MKKIHRAKKLALHGETLRKLDDIELTQVAGAVSRLICMSEQPARTCTPLITTEC